jgi:hypothetical protein
MSWIARLDARAAQWATPNRWAYQAAKWYLITTGAIALAGVLADRIGIWSLY